MSLFNELKRRNVFKVVIAYVIVAWLLLQVSDTLVPALHLPDWFHSGVAFVLILGFPVAIIFAWAFELTPADLKKEKDVDRSESITHITSRKLDFVVIGLLVVALGYFAYDKFVLDPGRDSAEIEAAVEVAHEQAAGPAESPGIEKSIAVLPFVNMSDDASNEYFSDGISEEILNALAHVKGLKVAGRTSSFAFKGRNQDLRLIGKTLNVSHILEGSVRKAGNMVRVTAQLIAVEDGFHLWADSYDRELTDIFAIQDEIAAAILGELKAELIGVQSLASSRTDPRAYEKYLLAKQRMYTRSRPDLEDAVELLDEALELDPEFAPAWAQRGILSMLLSDRQYGAIPYADSQAQAKRFLARALEIDEDLAEASAGLGLYHLNQPGSEESSLSREYLERALEINPSLINASMWLLGSLEVEQRMLEALVVLENVFERDPFYPPLLGNLSFVYQRMGRLDEFTAMLERVRPFLEGQPFFDMVEANLKSALGDHAGALPFAESAYVGAPTNQFAVGALGRALFFLNEFEPMLSLRWTFPGFKVRALHYLGRVEEASMLARQYFEATRVPDPVLLLMANAGQYEELMQFVEERWSSIEEFNKGQTITFGFGNPNLLHIAKACLETGRHLQNELAMKLTRAEHDKQRTRGADWAVFYVMEAFYWTLANDQDKAIDFLQQAVERGWVATPRMSRMWPLLKPLEGDPRYEEIQSRALKNLNRERVEAGLEPL